jgi:ComF family protein
MSSAPFWRAFVDFFLPPKCPFCGDLTDSFSSDRPCPSCLSRIKFFSPPRCPRCGIGFPSPSDQDHLCSGCLNGEPPFAKARSLCPYEGLIAEIIPRFKFGGVASLAKPLGILLAEYRDPEFPFSGIDLLIPVPLHIRRLRERGFNQSLLLAREVSRRRSIPLNFTALQRSRQTQPQTQLSGPQRQKNVRGAFEVRSAGVLVDKRVLLIDDVFTTGATVQECAKALLDAGAKSVDVLTLARVV